MATEESRASFVTELKAEQIGVKEQIGDIEALRSSLGKAEQALAKMQPAYRNMKIGGLQNTEAAKQLKARIDALKKSVGENQAKLLQYKGGLGITEIAQKKATKATKEGETALSKMTTAAKMSRGPMGELASKGSLITSTFGKVGLVGAAILAAGALVALDYAIVKTGQNLAKMAIVSADAYRSEGLAIEGMTKVIRGYWGFMQPKAGNANEMQKSIDAIAGDVPFAREKLVELNAELYRMRLRGPALSKALRAIAEGEAAAGEEGKQMGLRMVYGAALFGKSIDGAANIMHKRFGGIVQRQMLALPVQIAKAKENFAALFRGIQVEPVLKGLDKVLGLFKQGTVESQAWSGILKTLFNPLFKGAEEGGNIVKTFVDKVTILALRAEGAWLDMKGSFSLKELGIQDMGDLLTKATGSMAGFSVFMLRSAQGGLLLLDALKQVVDIGELIWKTGKAVVGSFNPTNTWKEVGANWKAVGDHASKMGRPNMMSTGISLIEGVIDGIHKAEPYLQKAAADAMKSAETAAKKETETHSPSQKWRRNVGRPLPQGAALGIRDDAPKMARAATSAMANIPPARMPFTAGGGGAGAAVGGGAFGNSVHVEIHELNVPSTPGAQTVTIPIADLRNAVASMLEGYLAQRGAAVGKAAA